MTTAIDRSPLFERVVRCDLCVRQGDCKVFRDAHANLPQPGFVGEGFERSRLVLIGANPGVGSTTARLSPEERAYADLLAEVGGAGGARAVERLGHHFLRYMPAWSMYKQYVGPLLHASGVRLDEIAYFNAVRCRTLADAPPSRTMAANCATEHLAPWLRELRPAAVVFVGKKAAELAGPAVRALGLPSETIDRVRSLPGHQREADRARIAAFIRAHLGR